MGYILQVMKAGKNPTYEKHRATYGPEARQLLQLWNLLELRDGVLLRHYEDTTRQTSMSQLVVPMSLWKEVLQELHAGVLGVTRGKRKC